MLPIFSSPLPPVKPPTNRFLLAGSQNPLDNRPALRYRWRMTEDERRDIQAENSVLRGALDDA